MFEYFVFALAYHFPAGNRDRRCVGVVVMADEGPFCLEFSTMFNAVGVATDEIKVSANVAVVGDTVMAEEAMWLV